MDQLKQKSLLGLNWSIINQFVSQALNFALAIILMRFISPDDYGLIAMVFVWTSFLSSFLNMGIDSAIIQHKQVNNTILSTVFWMILFIGIILMFTVILLSPVISWFYDESVLKLIAICLSLEFLLSSLCIVQFSLLQKNFNFKAIFQINILCISLSGILTIILAMQGWGVWSLVFKSISFSFFRCLFVWLKSEWKPKFVFKSSTTHALFNFGIPLMGTNILNYWARNIDDLLIGKFLGNQILGIYNRAYALMLLPVNNISGAVAKVMYPTLSIIQDDKEKVKSIYLKTSRIIALIVFPLMMSLYTLTDPIIELIIGAEWSKITPIVKVFSILGMLQAIGTLNGIVFLSQGATKLQFKLGIFVNSFMISMIILGLILYKDVLGVAIFYAVGSILAGFFLWHYMGKLISLKVSSILQNLQGVTFCTLAFTFSLYFSFDLLTIYFQSSFSILCAILFSFCFYWILLYLFKVKAYVELLNIIQQQRSLI